jgi:hypothetical protein
MTWIPLAVLLTFGAFGWSRLCFGAWTARHAASALTEKDGA